MENQARFCTNCGKALASEARFCPNCGTACAVAEPVVDSTVESVTESIVTPAEPEAPSVNIAMPIVAMVCGIMGFIFTLASLPEGGMWENFIFFLLASPAIALAIIFGLPNLKTSIAARRINTIIFSAIGLGTAAFSATISLIDLMVHLS